MKLATPRHKEILDAYDRHQSFTKAAEELGLTRQRVHAVYKKHRDLKGDGESIVSPCLGCGREVRHKKWNKHPRCRNCSYAFSKRVEASD